MQIQIKRFLSVLCITTVLVSVTGCNLLGNSKKTYKNYVQSILDTVYLEQYDEYMKITGATEEDAQDVYNQGVSFLADELMGAYGITNLKDEDLRTQFTDLSKLIYSHAKYEVGTCKKEAGVYTVEITVYPIDILQITYDDVVNYVETMNAKVAAGDYNDYSADEYESEYARGILDILKTAEPNIGNAEGVPLTVTIVDDGVSYGISDEDFKKIDETILATNIVSEDGTTPNNATTEAASTEAASTAE